MKVARCRRCLRPVEPAEASSFYPGGRRRFVNLHQACARDLEGGRMYKRGAFIAVEWAPHNRPPWPMPRTTYEEPEDAPIPKGKRRRDRRRPSKPGRRR